MTLENIKKSLQVRFTRLQVSKLNRECRVHRILPTNVRQNRKTLAGRPGGSRGLHKHPSLLNVADKLMNDTDTWKGGGSTVYSVEPLLLSRWLAMQQRFPEQVNPEPLENRSPLRVELVVYSCPMGRAELAATSSNVFYSSLTARKNQPVACCLWPVACGLGPGAWGLGPGAWGLGPVS